MPAVNLEVRSTYGELVKGVGVQFLDVFNQSLSSYSLALDDMVSQSGNKLTALAKQLTTQKSVEHFVQKTGSNYLSTTAEGVAFNSDTRILGYKTSVTPQLWSQSTTVSYQAMEDRSYDRELSEFGDLTVSAKETQDKSFFDMFNYAFTAQSSLPTHIYGYGDGARFCSIAHPRRDGGTNQRNTFAAATTQLTLTDTNLETARIDLLRQLDDRGKPTRVGAGKLILLVPTELEKQAVVITKGEKRSGTANNDINIYDGIMTVIASKWLAYSGNAGSLPTTAWFLLDPRTSKLVHLLRQGPKTHTYTDPNTLAKTFYIIARWANTWCDWRGTFGSLGDVSAYGS